MAWSPWLSALADALVGLYPTIESSRRLVRCARLPDPEIDYDRSPDLNWFNILNKTASHQGSALALLDCALREHPDHAILIALRAQEPMVVTGPEPQWHATQPSEWLEKITGRQNTLMPVRFLAMGLEAARAVARVARADGTGGTGFLVGASWLLTSHHVLPSPELAKTAVAQFNYEVTPEGTDAPIFPYPLDAARFETSAANDWTLVGIDPSVEREWGTAQLSPVEVTASDFVNIIQHPGGGPKHIAIYHNTVAYVGGGRVQYLTDTLPGSSGSPVFDSDWNVVALHRAGGFLREPGTKALFYRNEGVAATQLLEDFRARNIDLTRGAGVADGGVT